MLIDMLRRGQEGHVFAERDLFKDAAGSGARWIVQMHYSFQDVDHLYLVLEFLQGGDLLNLLIDRHTFSEELTRFYVAEMIMGIAECHRLGFIHRDIKPDNFIFTAAGHLKLSDFGLAQDFRWTHDGRLIERQRKQLLKKHGIDVEPTLTTWQGSRFSAASEEDVGSMLDDVLFARDRTRRQVCLLA